MLVHVNCNDFIFCDLNNCTIDLVPVSSTVIPVYSLHVNSTGEVKYHAMDDEEYRMAYIKLMHKKRKQTAEDPDTLITCNSNCCVV